jgi:two-component system phosphate regulon sensor histidine kinase PhoR
MDMLVLARIESEEQVFDIVSVEVPAVVAASLDDHRAAAEAKRISLSAPPHDAAGTCRVRADREGLRQILDNLLDNAVKYTPEGGRVSVDWRANGTMTYISVRDTGIGIGIDDQERIFERFYRVDKARSRELGGTGLGLSIVKHLAQSFGGTVNVESEPEKGSTFTVELPSG